MRKLTALFLAIALLLGCTVAMADNIKMDKLTLEFVPSKDAEDLREFAQRVQDQLPGYMGPGDIIFKPRMRKRKTRSAGTGCCRRAESPRRP